MREATSALLTSDPLASTEVPTISLPLGVTDACSAIGDIIEFWGLKRILGRIWTLLYLSPEPLSAAAIGKAFGISTGAVSMALNEMEHWGIIIRETQTGRRTFHYRAETQIWRMLSRVIRMRELHQLDRLTQTLKNAILMLEKGPAPSRASLETREFATRRLRKLLTMVEGGTEVFRIAFQESPPDLSSLQKIARIRQIFQKD